jgi:hypothetical protein
VERKFRTDRRSITKNERALICGIRPALSWLPFHDTLLPRVYHSKSNLNGADDRDDRNIRQITANHKESSGTSQLRCRSRGEAPGDAQARWLGPGNLKRLSRQRTLLESLGRAAITYCKG